MKKIVLLGDSIRQIGYGTKVPEMLGTDFSVWQPSDNCRFAEYTMRGVMYDWKNEIAGADVIHWNNGLWDVATLSGDGPFTPLVTYGEFMLRTRRCFGRPRTRSYSRQPPRSRNRILTTAIKS